MKNKKIINIWKRLKTNFIKRMAYIRSYIKDFGIIILALLSVYIYLSVYLIQAGYLNYYGIPTTFSEYSFTANASILSNFIFSLTSIIPYILTISLIIIIFAFIFWTKTSTIILTIILTFFMFKFSALGNLVAINNENYIVISDTCVDKINYPNMISPFIANDKIIFTEIDSEGNRTGKYYIIQYSNLTCSLERKVIKNNSK